MRHMRVAECVQSVLALPPAGPVADAPPSVLRIHSGEGGAVLRAEYADAGGAIDAKVARAKQVACELHRLCADGGAAALAACGHHAARVPFWGGIASAVRLGVLQDNASPEAALRRQCFVFLCCVAGEKLLTACVAPREARPAKKGGVSAGAPLLKDTVAALRGQGAACDEGRLALDLVEAVYLPQGLNLRNLVTHGYLEDVDPRYCSLVYAVLLLVSGSFAPLQPLEAVEGAGKVAPSLASLRCIHEALGGSVGVAEGSGALGRADVFRQSLVLLLGLEHRLRVLFCRANSDHIAATDALAQVDAYFITLDGYGQRTKHEVVLAPTMMGGVANQLPQLLGKQLYALLVDVFMAADGPNLRGLFVHGLLDIAALFTDSTEPPLPPHLDMCALLQLLSDAVASVEEGRAVHEGVVSYPCPGVCHPATILRGAASDASRACSAIDSLRSSLQVAVVDGAVEVTQGTTVVVRLTGEPKVCQRVETPEAFDTLATLRQHVTSLPSAEDGKSFIDCIAPPSHVGCHTDIARCVSAIAADCTRLIEAARDECAAGSARSNKRRSFVLLCLCTAPLVCDFVAFAASYLSAVLRLPAAASPFSEKLLQVVLQVRAWVEGACQGGVEKQLPKLKQFATSRASQDAVKHWRAVSAVSEEP